MKPGRRVILILAFCFWVDSFTAMGRQQLLLILVHAAEYVFLSAQQLCNFSEVETGLYVYIVQY
jgi:hypothetical protein